VYFIMFNKILIFLMLSLISNSIFAQGYDVFSPRKNVLSHNYDLKYRPSFHSDNVSKKSDHQAEEKIGTQRLKELLYKIAPSNHGSKGERTADSFWKLLGWDKEKKKMDKTREDYWCKTSPEF